MQSFLHWLKITPLKNIISLSFCRWENKRIRDLAKNPVLGSQKYNTIPKSKTQKEKNDYPDTESFKICICYDYIFIIHLEYTNNHVWDE